MKRITDLEKKYVLEALDNEFSSSLNNVFNNRLEKSIAELFMVNYAIGHVNGTATMHTALAALGIKPGDEVVVPPLTMASPSLAVLQNGSIPVFADVDLKTFNIDPKSVRKVITDKTKAIISVSLFGLAPDYDGLMEICNDFDLFLIEDNAQCFLGEYKKKIVGQFGHFSSYSFQSSKHLTCGEGGMLITNDTELANNARRFSGLGYAGIGASKGKITREEIQNPQYDRHVSFGFNYRMSELTAAVVLAQVERARDLVNVRIKAGRVFDNVVKRTDLLQGQMTPAECLNTYWAYSMVLNTKTPETDWFRFRKLFKDNGGDDYYAAWKLTYTEPLFQNKIQNINGVWQRYRTGLCPNAEYIQPRLIQLKTNYWNIDEAHEQANALEKTIREY